MNYQITLCLEHKCDHRIYLVTKTHQRNTLYPKTHLAKLNLTNSQVSKYPNIPAQEQLGIGLNDLKR